MGESAKRVCQQGGTLGIWGTQDPAFGNHEVLFYSANHPSSSSNLTPIRPLTVDLVGPDSIHLGIKLASERGS